jgi:hypothetical protein
MGKDLKEYMNDFVKKMKDAYEYIYHNYNYKQVLLIILVFFTIWLVEKINYFNAMSFGPVGPPIPMTGPAVTQSVPSKIMPKGKKRSTKRK